MVSFIRNPKDFWAGVLYVFFGASAVLLAQEYSMGSALKMGPGYFPTVLGGLLAIFGFISLVRGLIVPGESTGKWALVPLLLITLGTVLFGVLVRGGGLIVALPLLVLISAYASIKFRWGTAAALAVGLSVFCAVVFIKGLGVPLPILGSWFE